MTSIAFELAALLGVLASAWVAGGFLAKTRFFRNLPELTGNGRFGTLDGLRGFLALTVFFHHGEVHRNFLLSGAWIAPSPGVFRNAGPIPVQLFFMITGFLFWNQAIRNSGRVNWRDLAISRVARIAPLYLVSIVLTLALAALTMQGAFELTSTDVIDTTIRVLTLGAKKVEFLGEIDLMPFNAGVTWTLVYEWAFYASLLALAWFATPRRFPFLLLAFFAVMTLHDTFEVEQCLFFALGMGAAQLKSALPDFESAKSPTASWVVVGLFAFALVERGLDSKFVAAAFLFPAFLLIVYGNSMFGLLQTSAARVLGACSYSIYLLHGIYLYVFLDCLLGARFVPSLEPLVYWLMIFGASAVLVALCSLSFRWIEHPSIEKGKRLRRAIKGPVSDAQSS